MRLKTLTAALVAPLFALTIACGSPQSASGPQDQAEASPVTAAAVAAPTGPVTAFADGDYEVGTAAGQVPPGKYKTTAPADGLGCYWARLKGMGGGVEDIRANGNVAAGAPGIVTIAAADKGVTVSGGCTWRRA